MREGKLSNEELKKCLSELKSTRSEVLLGSNVGEDCAVIGCDSLLLVTTDPITSECLSVGELAVHINANDIYASGGEPFACTLTVIAPPNATVEQIAEVINEANVTAKSLDIDIVGGHTEFSSAVTRIIVSVTMLGKTTKAISNAKIQVGDSVIVTKDLGLEGSLILWQNNKNKLNLTAKQTEQLKSLNSKISVKAESLACQNLNVSCMHDITEGGIAGALAEVCARSQVGATIFEDKLPLMQATKDICKTLGIDAFGLMSSGSLLITTNEPQKALDSLSKCGVKGTVIGTICLGQPILVKADKTELILKIKADELYRRKL
ncbi:MAG: AIR synthase-related protein [Clostridia bacterium]